MSEELINVSLLSDLPDGQMKGVQVAGKEILIVNVEGTIYAMGGICTHREWPLIDGVLDGHRVICNGHGAAWDIRTGKAEYPMPLTKEIIYEVKVEGDEIFVKVQK